MGSRMLPVTCPHGVVIDWGDFGPYDADDKQIMDGERCQACEDAALDQVTNAILQASVEDGATAAPLTHEEAVNLALAVLRGRLG